MAGNLFDYAIRYRRDPATPQPPRGSLMSPTPSPRPGSRRRPRLRGALLGGLALATSFGVARPAAAATPPPASPTNPPFSFLVVPQSGPVITGSLTFGQPTQISTGGDAAPELELEIALSGDPVRPVRFRADHLSPLFPAVQVELTADTGDVRATFGYDATGVVAPDTFNIDLGGPDPNAPAATLNLAAH